MKQTEKKVMGVHNESAGPTSALERPPPSPRLVLASASPRRRELLGLLTASFDTCATSAEERTDPVPAPVAAALPAWTLPQDQHPTLRAWRKATAGRTTVVPQGQTAVVLGADTVVVLAGAVLNKPGDAHEACAMLAQLSGKRHTVYTGLCLSTAADAVPRFDLVAAEVSFGVITTEAITAYVATGEPFDKAGGYGIQGLGGRFVQQVVGSYTAVVGLPLPATWRLLAQAGVAPLCDPTDAYYRWFEQQRKEPLPCPPTRP